MRSLLTALKSGVKLLGATTLGYVLASAGTAQAQNLDPVTRPLPAALMPTLEAPSAAPSTPQTPQIFDPMIKPASGCAGCGASNGHNDYGRGNNSCVPGRFACNAFDSGSVCGRFCGGLCEEICCPDPCYEPRWIAEANAAFFQDSPRPVTQTRIRWDSAFDYRTPDAAEFFWAQSGPGKKGPKIVTPALRYNDLTLTQEVAAKGFSIATEIPYRTFEPVVGDSGSGMGDMSIAVKTVLLDRELLLITMQMKTFIPTGNFTGGTGTGHATLEPSLLAACKLGPVTYLQMEFAEWIPLGGTPGFTSCVFHYHFSLNHNLCHWGDCLSVIGTLELNGWNFNGAYTDFATGAPVGLDGANYLNFGPGIRVQICDRIDFGFGAAFGFGNLHGPGQIYRSEMRVRF